MVYPFSQDIEHTLVRSWILDKVGVPAITDGVFEDLQRWDKHTKLFWIA